MLIGGFAKPALAEEGDISITTEKLIEVLSFEQMKKLQDELGTGERSLSNERKVMIEEVLRQNIRAMIKSKTFATHLFESIVQNYPDFIAFKIIYTAAKYVVVNPALIYAGYGEAAALLATLPEDYAVYGGIRLFKNWYNEIKMRAKYKISTNERDALLSSILEAQDYKKLTLHILKNEKNLLVLPLSKDGGEDSGLKDIATIEELEKLVGDSQFIKDLKLMSIEKTIYQTILLNTVLDSDNGQDKLMKLLATRTTFESKASLLLADLLRTQKSIQIMGVKFSAMNVLMWLKKESRDLFFKQSKVSFKLNQKVQQLEEMKWKIALDIKKGKLTESQISQWRRKVDDVQLQTEFFLSKNMAYSKISFCPAVFVF